MEKLDKPQKKEYRPLEIWAGDLIDLFSELKVCSNLELRADDVKYESVDEFFKESKGRNPTVLKISARNPYLTLELTQSWAHLYVSSSQLLASGLFHNIDSILSRCERKPKFLYRYLWVVGSVWILPGIFYLAPLKPYSYLSIFAKGLMTLWVFYVLFINCRRFSVIHLLNRNERPSFYRRNSDAIVVAIISGLLGAVGGALATKLADTVWPNSPNPAVEREVPQAKLPLAPTPSP